MPKIIQSHSFSVENQNQAEKIVRVGLVLASASTMALAADPAWYTTMMTTLTWIGASVGAVLSIVIGIRLAPLAWIHIKRVLYR
ncbi:hypothetical protein [Sulfurimonas sp.]|uniref:hypothetical protein n=1 Tax=Sulfurimonas sp. TaxID=2022749 RepID=UPI002B491D38|nr:hypothetical protein [Sulfurimonas sp.]